MYVLSRFGSSFPTKLITKTFDRQSFLEFTISDKGLWACTNDNHKVQKLGPDFIPKSWLDIPTPADCPSGHLAQRKHTHKAHGKRKLNSYHPNFFSKQLLTLLLKNVAKWLPALLSGAEKSQHQWIIFRTLFTWDKDNKTVFWSLLLPDGQALRCFGGAGEW